MRRNNAPNFYPGRNIAIKTPAHEFDAVVKFYREVLGLFPISDSENTGNSVVFNFGGKRLWIDRVEHITHSETWFEIQTDNVEAAKGYLDDWGVTRRDELEPLPPGFEGFWVSSPGNIINLISPKQP